MPSLVCIDLTSGWACARQLVTPPLLQAVRGEPAAELPEDDLEDADFELDWSELLPGEAPGQGLAQAQNQATGQQALQPSAPRPRTRAQHRRVARELESTARLRDRCACACPHTIKPAHAGHWGSKAALAQLPCGCHAGILSRCCNVPPPGHTRY